MRHARQGLWSGWKILAGFLVLALAQCGLLSWDSGFAWNRNSSCSIYMVLNLRGYSYTSVFFIGGILQNIWNALVFNIFNCEFWSRGEGIWGGTKTWGLFLDSYPLIFFPEITQFGDRDEAERVEMFQVIGASSVWVHQSCPHLCDLMDCSLPGSSVIGFSRQEYWSG